MNNAHHTTTTTPAGHFHLAFPKAFLAVRILQIILALLVLGLTASLLATTDGFSFTAEGFALFTALAALIVSIYAIVAERRFGHHAPHLFALLALEILMVIFWLSAMADLASLRSAFRYAVDYDFLLKKRAVYFATRGYLNVLTADVVIAAFNIVLWAVSLFFVAKAFHTYRLTHLGGSSSHHANNNMTGTQLGHVDHEKHAGLNHHHNNTTTAQPTGYAAPAANMGYNSPSATLVGPYDGHADNHGHGAGVGGVSHQYTAPPAGVSEVDGHRGVAGSTV